MHHLLLLIVHDPHLLHPITLLLLLRCSILSHISRLPSEHELLAEHVNLLLLSLLLLLLLLDSVRVPERVQRVLAAGVRWGNVRYHGCL